MKNTKMMCPSCDGYTIPRWRIALTALGLPAPMKCQQCGAYCSASANVQGNLLGLMLLGLVLSAGFSIQHRSFLFYAVFAASVLFSVLFAVFVAKPVKVAKPSVKGFVFLLIAAVVVLVLPNILTHFL
jgi:hypothetical protein